MCLLRGAKQSKAGVSRREPLPLLPLFLNPQPEMSGREPRRGGQETAFNRFGKCISSPWVRSPMQATGSAHVAEMSVSDWPIVPG